MKICTKCGVEKPHTDFYKNRERPDGLRLHCKECVKTYRNLDSERTASQRWVDNNPAGALLRAAKHRAKKRGMEFDIDITDIIIPSHCPVFGFELKVGRNRKRCNESATLDRIDNNKGYIKGNVVVVSWKANCLKRNFTNEDMQKVLDFYTKIKE